MLDAASTPELIARVRAGDAHATTEFVRRYEPIIRSCIRVWLRMQDTRLRRVFDSVDICQSVLASFFVRAAAGQYELNQPEQLIGLLKQMARNKLTHQVEKQTAQRRDIRRTQHAGLEGVDPAARDETPSACCIGRELFEEFRKRLSSEERALADLRAEGEDWAGIAEKLGGTPDGRRMQLGRALDRVSMELGLAESSSASV